MSELNIRPLGDRVIVKRAEKEQVSAGGIVIPESVKGERPAEGVVVAVGAGKHMDNGDHRAVDVKKGDKILFGKYAGSEVKLGNDEYLVLREEDIMAVLI